MDVFTNEGTAERIGQRHLAINKNFYKGGKATVIAALATASLIQKILDRFKEKGGKQGPGLVEIKIDNKIVTSAFVLSPIKATFPFSSMTYFNK